MSCPDLVEVFHLSLSKFNFDNVIIGTHEQNVKLNLDSFILGWTHTMFVPWEPVAKEKPVDNGVLFCVDVEVAVIRFVE